MFRTIALSIAVLCAMMAATMAPARDAPVDPDAVHPSQDPARTANGLALTPPMGWNSWEQIWL